MKWNQFGQAIQLKMLDVLQIGMMNDGINQIAPQSGVTVRRGNDDVENESLVKIIRENAGEGCELLAFRFAKGDDESAMLQHAVRICQRSAFRPPLVLVKRVQFIGLRSVEAVDLLERHDYAVREILYSLLTQRRIVALMRLVLLACGFIPRLLRHLLKQSLLRHQRFDFCNRARRAGGKILITGFCD